MDVRTDLTPTEEVDPSNDEVFAVSDTTKAMGDIALIDPREAGTAPLTPTTFTPGIEPTSEASVLKNPALLYLGTLHSETSRLTMGSKLNVVARWTGASTFLDCAWHQMRAEHVVAFLAYLEHKHTAATSTPTKGSTLNTYLAALKGVAKAAWMADQMDHDTYLRIQAIKQRRYHRLPTGRSLAPTETSALIEDCDAQTCQGCRDKAILLLMIGCGLRRGEVPLLRYENLDRLDASIRLVGKGDKERKIFLPDRVLEAVLDWVERFRGTDPGYLFGRIYKNGRLHLEAPLASRSVGDLLSRHTQAMAPDSATHEVPKTTSHDLRRTFATRLLDDNVDIVTVKNMMGHANISTTAQYDRRGESALREASKKVKI